MRIQGLEYSMFGKMRDPGKRRFLRRLPVTITLERFDNVTLDGGPSGLNGRIEQYFNHGVPLAVKAGATPLGGANALQSAG